MTTEQIIIKKLEDMIKDFEELCKKGKTKCYVSSITYMLNRLIDFIYDAAYINSLLNKEKTNE